MTKWIGCVSFVLLFVGNIYAYTPLEHTLTRTVMRAVFVKPYYTTEEVSALCEKWSGCAKWAKEQYARDHSFKVSGAKEVTSYRVYRHWARYETRLHVTATYNKDKKIRKIFEPNPHSRRGI